MPQRQHFVNWDDFDDVSQEEEEEEQPKIKKVKRSPKDLDFTAHSTPQGHTSVLHRLIKYESDCSPRPTTNEEVAKALVNMYNS